MTLAAGRHAKFAVLACVEYDPDRASAQQLIGTLRDIGYTVWDPRKTRTFQEEEAELVDEAGGCWRWSR